MHGNPFYRAHIAQICGFIRTGEEYFGDDAEGTANEKSNQNERAFYAGMRKFRDLVIQHDWSRYETENEKNIASEKMWVDVVNASGNLSDLYFEIGFQAGLQLGQEIQGTKTILESEEMNMNEEYVRKIDDLGRVVLPRGLRQLMNWQERDALQITKHSPTQIILEKAYPTCFICGASETLVQIGEINVCAICRDRLKGAKDGDKIEIAETPPTSAD